MKVFAALVLLLASIQLAEAVPTTFNGLQADARWFDMVDDIVPPRLISVASGPELHNFAELFNIDFDHTGNTVLVTFTNAYTANAIRWLYFDWTNDGQGKYVVNPGPSLVTSSHASSANAGGYGDEVFSIQFNSDGTQWQVGDVVQLQVLLDNQGPPPEPVVAPELSSLLLLLGGLAGLGIVRRRIG